MNPDITVIGGGLAGCEAAWQIARRGLHVQLYEMRPTVSTPAHTTDQLGELVCSNSLKSDLPGTAPYLLKQELRQMDSLLLRIAEEVKVPAGHALAVDREMFSHKVTSELSRIPLIRIIREEIRELPDDGINIVDFGQGYLSMSAPSKRLESLIYNREIQHDGSPVMRWNFACCSREEDPAGNIKPVKTRGSNSNQRIDGVVALTMALGVMQKAEPAASAAFWTV